ncbi:methionyl-tRNA formyltransferase [Desulfurispira natronophila]|uniref:Methionyl-tRNA formyltransferase n=1 Tax=Desulfurispira natronophila TaxID=682562 RepID=A0A7W8DGK0_9BACT|nr:formyltransferase family protein [Desulfurispira natronophila]MBB5021452.1 methionyl-tRNA formyltransferase [Desulfurispira natronophila]
MNIAVFGYSDFTRRCVQELMQKGHQVLLLCPRADQAHFETNAMAELNADIANFENMQDPNLLDILASFSTDYIFSIIFGYKIPPQVLQQARHGSINFHPAPLPEFRTANAWFWPLRMGVKESAICLHHMTQQWDSGNVILRLPFRLAPYETQGGYVKQVGAMAPTVIDKLEPMLLNPPLPAGEKQDSGAYYPRVTLRDLFIDFTQTTVQVEDLIRACNPFHPAQTMFRGENIEIVEAELVSGTPGQPGELHRIGDSLQVSCQDGRLQLHVVNVPLTGSYSAQRFAQCYEVKTGEMLEPISHFPQYAHLLDQ